MSFQFYYKRDNNEYIKVKLRSYFSEQKTLLELWEFRPASNRVFVCGGILTFKRARQEIIETVREYQSNAVRKRCLLWVKFY